MFRTWWNTKNAVVDSPQYKFAWILEIIAYCAVNIFGLISGYVGYSDKEKKYKFSRIILLWLEVVFYGLVITAIFKIIQPGTVHKEDFISSLFPITNNLFWYFTCYLGVFIMAPFINKGIRAADNKFLKKLFIAIIILFSFYSVFNDIFTFKEGYTFIWLLLLYILGAIIKKCEIGKNLKNGKAILIVLPLLALTYIFYIYGFKFDISRIHIDNELFLNYVSPTILITAIIVVIQGSKMKFGNVMQKNYYIWSFICFCNIHTKYSSFNMG